MASVPLVSVVVPAYNAERTVAQAIQSVLGQTMQDLELLVVDDGSVDATAVIVGKQSDPRVRLISRENGGVAAARNTGIAEARGEWVAFLDADDVWLQDKLERQLRLMAAAPGCRASEGSAYFVDSDLNPLGLHRCIPVDNPLLAFLCFKNLPNAASTWIVQRAALALIGGFDTTLERIEDWEFSIRVARYGSPICIAEPLSLYRVHEGNRSHDVAAHIGAGQTILDRLFADPTLPSEIRARKREIYARFYTMLCGGMLRIGDVPGCLRWGMRAVLTDPCLIGYMALTPLRRVRRRLALHDGAVG
jgi:glycosyltransferase involved in cell wall biosynthesis